jgi:uncharacterized protein (DUF362 family)/Pyruvate/2-oxoacid:ferredoxin oxidoreductase delta subunit
VTRVKVAAVKTEGYEDDGVQRSLESGLDLIGALDESRCRNLLVKPNCLSPKSPSQCVTTHPSVVKAVVRVMKERCDAIIVGDQPGSAHGERALEVSGIKRVCEEEGVLATTFEGRGYEPVTVSEMLGECYFAKAYLDADLVISVSKLKTHVQTKYTGAVKNVFGAVPLKTRRLAHALAHRLPEALVDIYSYSPPSINVMDAVWGMEGDGPSQGRPKYLGLLFASRDAVALDAVASYLMGFDPMEIDTTRIAHGRGIGVGDLTEIEVVGEEIGEYRRRFKRPTSLYMRNARLLSWMLYSLSSVRPKLHRRHCRKCGGCVEICSVDAISMNPYPRIDYDRCIECFSCAEVCEHDAIRAKRVFRVPLLSRLSKA